MRGLPDGWKCSSLSELAHAVGGGTPSKAESAYWTNGTIPWASPKDMKVFEISETQDALTKLALVQLAVIPVDSVLVVVRSGILSRTLPVALNKVPLTINQDMRAFVPQVGISSRYVALQLIAAEQRILDECSKDGTTVASIEGAALAHFPIDLAPAAEQTRIVAKLEELLGALDAGVAELKAAQKKLVRYRQSLLKAAVSGELTAAWREQNPASETGQQILTKILHQRRTRWETTQTLKFQAQGKAPPKGWKEKYVEPLKPDVSGLPELPQGWVWASFDQLTQFITSGSRGWADFYATSGATFIRSQDIRRDWLDLSDAAFVNPPTGAEGARTMVRNRDLLLTITGANVGKAARVETEIAEAYVSQHVALIRLVEVATSGFAHMYLTASAGGRGRLDKQAYGAGKPGLNLEQIASLAMPLPNLAELSALMALLETQMQSVNAQSAAISHALHQSTAQRKNILQAAFSGQLVPQDPNDEPASELLARIRAAHQAELTLQKSKRRIRQESA